MAADQNQLPNKDPIPPGTILVGPDPVSAPDMLHAGSFIYFDSPILLTTPPEVVTAEESFKLRTLIESARPKWEGAMYGILSSWQKRKAETGEMFHLLEPLKETSFKVIWPAYPADDAALNRAGEFIASSQWSPEKLLSSVDPGDACGELVRHIFLEKFLELDKNLDDLFEYCSQIFVEERFTEILVRSYTTRLLAMLAVSQHLPIALTNPALVYFLADLPQPDAKSDDQDPLFTQDAVSMVIFNTLLSHWLDPLTSKTVDVIAELKRSRQEEIDRLKGKCLSVSEKLDLKQNPDHIFEAIEKEVRYNILPEVKELLRISDAAFKDYVEKVLADRIFWTGFLGSVVSVFYGPAFLSAAAAVSTIASIGTNAFSHYREAREKIRKSDFKLIYTVGDLKK